MPRAQIVKLATKAELVERDEMARVRAAIADLPLSPNIQRIIHGALRGVTAQSDATGKWEGTYTMISTEAVAATWAAIRALPPAKRPHLVRHVFDEMLLALDFNTGMVLLSRNEIAARVGCKPNSVSEAATTLEEIGTIEREVTNGSVTYYINPNVAWRGQLMTRERAARSAQRSLKLIGGTETKRHGPPPTERRRGRAAEQPAMMPA